jgi:hypothetical protein
LGLHGGRLRVTFFGNSAEKLGTQAEHFK